MCVISWVHVSVCVGVFGGRRVEGGRVASEWGLGGPAQPAQELQLICAPKMFRSPHALSQSDLACGGLRTCSWRHVAGVFSQVLEVVLQKQSKERKINQKKAWSRWHARCVRFAHFMQSNSPKPNRKAVK